MFHVCIVQFNLIEGYPPVVNFLRYLSSFAVRGELEVTVITTAPETGISTISIPGITIERVAKWKKGQTRIQRLLSYWLFARRAFQKLKKANPNTLLYYETLSAAAPFWYKRFKKPSVHLYIHYHEYISNQEYKDGMVVAKWLHKLEKNLYPRADCISHTNEDRLNKFMKDIGKVLPGKTTILPNYPPLLWQQESKSVKRNEDSRIGFVYVGALSFDTMYAREMIDFVRDHEDSCYWDIYSNNFEQQVIEYLESVRAKNIHFKGGVSYDMLPYVLGRYDIGLILYKGTTPNFVYNAPNKFFEYHCCGLNVWFSSNMIGMLPYIRKNTNPWIKAVDFRNLSLEKKENLLRPITAGETEFIAEQVYEKFLERMWEKEPGS